MSPCKVCEAVLRGSQVMHQVTCPKLVKTAHKRRFVFQAGIRKVTVHERTYENACSAARASLDRRANKAGRESPVAWTLELLSVT